WRTSSSVGSSTEDAFERVNFVVRQFGEIGPHADRTPALAGVLKHAIALQQSAIGLRNEITQDWLVAQSMEILRHALAPVQSKDRYGKPTGPEMRQLGAANTAIFNLAKLTGNWVDKRAEAPPNLVDELFQAIGARPMKLIEQEPDDEAKE
ncbi:MAG: hypothetical protein V3R79_07130, partial [Alphaproteobacteria bacterium]